MEKRAIYDGREKSYYVETKKKKLNTRGKLLFIFTFVVIFLCLGLFGLKNSLLLNTNKVVSYKELGNVDYKVYLKENSYYKEKYLLKGMKYIASIINTINVDFNYDVNSIENLLYEYTYKINARLVITDKNETKVLYDNNYVLLEETTKKVNSNIFSIKEDVDIDYDEYNNYVNAFKRDYALTVDSNLIVTMDIKVTALYENEDPVTSTNQLQISIPMSEQTIDISMETEEINKSNNITETKHVSISNNLVFMLSVLSIIISICLIVLLVYTFIKKDKRKDLYNKTIAKYLKEYDRIIITSKQPNVDERAYDEVIRVMDISELIDLHDMSAKPIIYYEVIPNEKSYFIVIYDRSLYKLTITRAWLERNASQNGEKNEIA